ncbi:MAG: Na/Pi cotransporter family protein [Planctomycetota bacterium]|jgi:Na/Pi-cotransporter
MSRRGALALLYGLSLVLAGCGNDQPEDPASLKVIGGDEQCAPLGGDLDRELLVQVLSKSGNPVGKAEVRFRISAPVNGAQLRPSSSAEEDEGGPAIVVASDAGGLATTIAVPPSSSSAEEDGLNCASGLEGHSGQCLEKPLVLTVAGPDGKPRPGARVFFRIEHAPSGTRLTEADHRTDHDGRAVARIRMGSGTGPVVVTAAVDGFHRPARFRLFCLAPWKIAIVVIGGLALFILGMKIMSDGLTRVAGEKMKLILQACTRNQLVGVGVGALITAVIQSSSATSVMVVGFVNAGLLTLERSVGLIMGANIGTTVTAQMIAFKLDSLALPAVALGVAIQLIAKRKSAQQWGMVLTGFGILFTGLATMGGILKGLQHSPTITGLFSSIDCTPVNGHVPIKAVLLGIGIGTLVTVIVQSSSASIGLLQVLASTGLLNFYTAFPILLGDNIGTTTTALLASIGATRNARRAAMANLLLKTMGTLIMFGIFMIFWENQPIFLHLVNKLTLGNAFAGENLPRHIANAHTLFNIGLTALFLPLVPLLSWMCRRVVPETTEEREEKPRYLEPHLLDAPALALDRARSELIYMTKLSRKAIAENFSAFRANRPPSREKLDRREQRIDDLQHDITNYLVKLSQRDLLESESRQLPLLMHSVNDAERIGDHAENLLELAERRVERRLPFSQGAEGELNEMYGEVEAMFDLVITLLEESERPAAERALRCEERINDLARELGQNHVHRLEQGECNLTSGVVFLDMVANLEKVGDHLTNIAQAGRDLIGVRNGD